ncbi:MAG: hypothetical protein KDD61_10535 [Bdellovibrionales bacterium]|nr:hypothetical protein [Bdellovibrionales bacterium]
MKLFLRLTTISTLLLLLTACPSKDNDTPQELAVNMNLQGRLTLTPQMSETAMIEPKDYPSTVTDACYGDRLKEKMDEQIKLGARVEMRRDSYRAKETASYLKEEGDESSVEIFSHSIVEVVPDKSYTTVTQGNSLAITPILKKTSQRTEERTIEDYKSRMPNVMYYDPIVTETRTSLPAADYGPEKKAYSNCSGERKDSTYKYEWALFTLADGHVVTGVVETAITEFDNYKCTVSFYKKKDLGRAPVYERESYKKEEQDIAKRVTETRSSFYSKDLLVSPDGDCFSGQFIAFKTSKTVTDSGKVLREHKEEVLSYVVP